MSKVSVRSSGRAPLTAGGGKKGVRWATLVEESDEEVDVVVVEPKPIVLRSLVNDPLYVAMSRGDVLWGDLCMDDAAAVVAAAAPVPVPVRQEPVPEDVFWGQPWAERLEMNGGDNYDARPLSDAEWAACMTWLYANGWYVWAEGRTGFSAIPDTLPPRVWVPPQRPACCGAHAKKEAVPMSAPGSDAGRRRAAPRPIFCNGGEKCKEGCPYVHGDTIPVQNAPCQF